MARANSHLMTNLLRGSVGRQLTIYTRGNQTIIAQKRGPSKKKPTAKQLAAREQMREAAAYARSIIRDPELRQKYEKMAGPDQNAYNMALGEWYVTQGK